MELLESDDPKSQLIKRSQKHRDALKAEADLLGSRTEKAVTNALIVGGALAVTYILVKQFSRSSKKRKSKGRKIKIITAPAVANGSTQPEYVQEAYETPGVMAQVGTAVASQAVAFLLALAKEKLSEYLESQFIKKEEDAERA